MRNKIDYGFRVYHDVLKLNYIHFGYWEDTEKLSMENLEIAQDRYTNHLLSFIPSEVRSILDVGCGNGSTAEKLIQKGYHVSCLSPDPYQKDIINKKFNGQIQFYLTKFEDFENDSRYDLILMSESVQYQNLEKSFKKLTEILRPNSYLLSADYFRRERTKYYNTCHVESKFLDIANKYGFEIIKTDDITQKVLPTLDMARILYERHAIPFANLTVDFLKTKFPILSKVAGFMLKSKLAKLENYIYEYTPNKLDSQKFSSMLKYMIYLFKLK